MEKKDGIIVTMGFLAGVEDGKNKFAEWLDSTNKEKECLRAWQQIVALGDRFEETEAGKRNLFSFTYGRSTPYSTRKVNGLLKQLEYLLHEFLVDNTIKQSGYRDLIAAEYYHKMGQYERRDAALQAALNKATQMDQLTRRQIIVRVKHHQYFYSNNKETPEGQAILAEYRANAFEFCDIFKASIERLTYLQMRGAEIPEQLSTDFMLSMALLPAQPSTLIRLQVLAIKLLLKPDVEAYAAYKTAYLQDSISLTSERYYLLTTAINVINIFPHLRKKKRREELFFWYKFSMDENIFEEEGASMSMTRFNNIVLIFNSLGQFAALEKFVATHRYLIKNNREQKNSVSLAQCHILFEKKQFEEVLVKLKKTISIHYTFTLWKMILKAKCIYELRAKNIYAADEIDDIKASFVRMVYRYFKEGRFNTVAKIRYLNFFKLLSKLLSIKSNQQNLKRLLDSFKGLSAERKWLVAQVVNS